MGRATSDPKPGGGYLNLSREYRAAAAEQARILRLNGESLGVIFIDPKIAEGMKEMAGGLKDWSVQNPEAGTALPRPQEPMQQRKPRKRAAGGGAKRKLSDDMIERGKTIVRRELDLDPGWASHFYACCNLVVNRLKLTCHWQTVGAWIVKPVLIERGLR